MYPLSEVFVLRILWRSILLALTLALLLAPAVVAHAELESATPGPNDEVVGPPTELVTQFSQNLDPSRTTLDVRDAAGTRIARGGEPGDGKREFRLALPELAPGEYEVRWTSYSSEDRELARGSYTFAVLPAPSPTPSATPSPSARPYETPPPSPPATPTTAPTVRASEVPAPPTTATSTLDTVLPIAATALVVAIVLVWLMRRRRP
jgi:methionine-rich copper-binding protein CopC